MGNKNAKQNKKRKQKMSFAQMKRRRINRPDEVSFNEDERKEFVTGFARRKQERRIKAAKDLLTIENQQHIECRKERRDMETAVLVKGGHMQDPIKLFLGEDYNDGDSHSSDASSDTVSDIEQQEEQEEVMDIDELFTNKN